LHVCSFSPTGKLLGTVALGENILDVWQPLIGLMSFIAPLGGESLKPYRTFQIGPNKQILVYDDIIDVVKFVWTGERAIRFHSKIIDLAFNV
jgi:hypothetical protein